MPKPTSPPRPRTATTTPLTVDVSKEAPAPAPAAPAAKNESATIVQLIPNSGQPVHVPEFSQEDADRQAAVAALMSPDLLPFNEQGGIDVTLEHPIDVSRFGITGVTTINVISLKRCQWKDRIAAARNYGPNATAIDQDTAIIAQLSGLPAHIIGELDARDGGMVQMALGKLLYSPQML